MLTFIRGPSSFLTKGQVYVKLLPDGEPKPLTDDNLTKMSPVFSPDGSRIAYTTSPWDTWVVPVLGGEPRRWLPNASGLVWNGKHDVVFSEVIDRLEGNHMKVVAAEESRARPRDVYVPSPKGAMAHRSFPSPDGKWLVLAEMTDRGTWLPCRVVPADGTSNGRTIGPPEAACWFAAWTPDGNWIYVSSSAGGSFHIWRQRHSAGAPSSTAEQITSGPTSEEGIAMAPDGRSFITAVGLEQKGVWVHDSRGERQISVEGRASEPRFSPDGKTLFFVAQKGASAELWFADVDSGRAEPLLPNFDLVSGNISRLYDISPDGRQVVVHARDAEGKDRIWIAPLNRRSPPRQIPNA
jgi:Tol biopolymer transport system component